MDDPFIRALSSAIWICNGFARRLDSVDLLWSLLLRGMERYILGGKGKRENDEKILNGSVYGKLL